jgi:hypothetical protein|tara:strand:+ start:1123 stop:1398 length:276 start_codon:yes stop_codon:yes gene_type:complete
MKIIYNTPEGTLDVITPSLNWKGSSEIPITEMNSDQLAVAMEELAQKCVPKGLKYKIVADNFLPSTREYRNAWEIEASELTDGVGVKEGIT